MAAPAFFVPLVIAGAKIFFKFVSKKAAQNFKSNYAKAGSITTKAPPKNATVTTTGSAKGKSVLKDLKSPVTAPSVRARNPNTTTLPKAPKKSSGAGTAAASTAVGATAASTSTSKSADKSKSSRPSKTSDQARSEARVAANQRQLAAKSAAQGGGSVLSKKKKPTTPSRTEMGSAAGKPPVKKKMATPTPPPKRPKKSKKTSKPTPKPKMYTAINVRTGKPDFDAPKVTAAERLKQEDKYKAYSAIEKAAKASIAKKKKMNKGGAALKTVPAGNMGLKRLPTSVRNRMGFMRKGGVAKKK